MKHLTKPLRRILMYRKNKAVISSFADENGLVYFGHVDQHGDEHKIIRGLTVSVSHTDAHYCIGSFDGYDIALVERTDTLKPTPARRNFSRHRWFIMELDLHRSSPLPHCFIGKHVESDTFYKQLFAKYPRLSAMRPDLSHQQSFPFISKYSIFSSPENAHIVQQLLSNDTLKTIHDHFGSLAIEVKGKSLYFYAETPYASTRLLEAMIKNGVWLARRFDDFVELT